MSAFPKSDKVRFRGSEKCPICHGCDDDPRGNGSRCHGWRQGDWAYCSREERSGGLAAHPEAGTYAHKLHGECPCGESHGPSLKIHHKSTGRIEEKYVYRDEAGQPLYRVVRKRLDDGSKSFYQQLYHPQNGTFKGGLNGIKTVPYRLPELVKADPSTTVYVVEGEKDVDNLRAIGLVATCNPMGAGKWKRHHADYLVNRNVVVLPDNDDVGRDHAQDVARSLVGKAAFVTILELPNLPEKGDVSDWLKAGGTADQLRELAAAAPTWEAPPVEQSATADKPVVTITPYESEVADEAVAALASDPNLYVMASLLATVVDSGKPLRGVDYRKAPPPPQIQTLEPITIRDRITSHALLVKFKKNRDGEDVPVHVHPPDWLSPMIYSRGVYPGIRQIRGVIEAPTLRPDGSILDKAGYDEDTELFFKPNATFDPVPDRPTRRQAEEARDLLFDVVCDFPFKSPAARAVWLAGLATMIARAAVCGPCPLFVFDANTAGAGKSKLADIIAMIATGRLMPRTAWPTGQNSDDEVRKHITSIALAGSRMMLIDNIDEPLGGAALDAALTTDTWQGRLLGKSKVTPELPLITVWYCSGNNVQCRTDVMRRVLFSRIESLEEHPEERQGFKYEDVVGHCWANRGKLVAAVLTILRAFHVSGAKTDIKLLGSFEDWTRKIAEPIYWITGVDPLEVRKTTQASDATATTRNALVAGWAELPNSHRGLTVPEALKLVENHADHFEMLRSALMELSHNSALPSPKSTGKYLGRLEGKVVDGKILRSEINGRKPKMWRIEKTGTGGLGFRTADGGLALAQTPDTNSFDNQDLQPVGGLRGLDPMLRVGNSIDEALESRGDTHVISPGVSENKPPKPQTPSASYEDARFGVFNENDPPAF